MDGSPRSSHLVAHDQFNDVLVTVQNVAMRESIEEGAPEPLVLTSNQWLIFKHEPMVGRHQLPTAPNQSMPG